MPDRPIDFTAYVPDAAETADAADSGTVPSLTWPDPGFIDEASGQWGFGLTVGYFWDSGIRYAPKAGRARSGMAVWRAHGETTLKVITCLSARVDGTPALPHVDTGDPNDVLLTREFSVPIPSFFPDGTPTRQAMVTYWYLMQQPQDIDEPILIPNSVLKLTGAVQLYPASFSRNYTGGSVSPGDFTGSKITY